MQRQQRHQRARTQNPTQPSAMSPVGQTQQRGQDQPTEKGQQSLFAELPQIAAEKIVTRPMGTGEYHLKAAQRIAKKLRSRRTKTPQRRTAGVAICRHLIALLEESNNATKRPLTTSKPVSSKPLH